MSEIWDNMYIDRFLFVAFVKYTLSQIYSNCIRNCTFEYFLEIVETVIFCRKYFQNLLILVFYRKISNFHNSGMVSHRELLDPSIKNIFNILLIALQYTLSFKSPDFILKCGVFNNAKCL